jgi:NAD(P)-dependent dehydrogenase (short-subunit alcohol dehydrogenase family)
MSHYPPSPDRSRLVDLKGQVVVITGGASGIGAALVSLLYLHGANIFFGDINRQAGDSLVRNLESERASQTDNEGEVTFLLCDVCKYEDLYTIFRAAWDKHGYIDHAVFCAGILDDPTSSYFDTSLTIDSVGKKPGSIRTLEVNFLATCSFSRIALPFLRCHQPAMLSDRSLTILSSVTGFRDAPGMFLYQTSKQAMLGLMRAMRSVIFARDGIRINAVCPGMTESPMTTGGLIELFRDRSPQDQAKRPSHYQTAMAVAEHIASILLMKDLNGKSIYVEGGKGWDFEDGLLREMPRWLGDEPTKWSNENLEFLANKFGTS